MIIIRKNYIYKLLCLLLVISCCFVSCRAVDEDVISSSSLVENSESSTHSSESSLAESSTTSSENANVTSDNSQVDAAPAKPSEEMPVSNITQADSVPETSQSQKNADTVYESVKISLTRVEIDGTTHVVEVDDDKIKEKILNYISSMQASDYTVRNTPPGGGQIIDVEVQRNDTIEQYKFSSQTVDGNTLGKDLYNSDTTKWTIVDKDAFPYLLSLFPVQ